MQMAYAQASQKRGSLAQTSGECTSGHLPEAGRGHNQLGIHTAEVPRVQRGNKRFERLPFLAPSLFLRQTNKELFDGVSVLQHEVKASFRRMVLRVFCKRA